MGRRRNSSWCSGLGATWPTWFNQGTAKVPRSLGETGTGGGANWCRVFGENIRLQSFQQKKKSFQQQAWKLLEQKQLAQGDGWKSRFQMPCYYLRSFCLEASPAGVCVHQHACAPGSDQAGNGRCWGNPPTTQASFLLPLSRQLTFDLSAPWSV